MLSKSDSMPFYIPASDKVLIYLTASAALKAEKPQSNILIDYTLCFCAFFI